MHTPFHLQFNSACSTQAHLLHSLLHNEIINLLDKMLGIPAHSVMRASTYGAHKHVTVGKSEEYS